MILLEQIRKAMLSDWRFALSLLYREAAELSAAEWNDAAHELASIVLFSEQSPATALELATELCEREPTFVAYRRLRREAAQVVCAQASRLLKDDAALSNR